MSGPDAAHRMTRFLGLGAARAGEGDPGGGGGGREAAAAAENARRDLSHIVG
jgi:hypothetical protein